VYVAQAANRSDDAQAACIARIAHRAQTDGSSRDELFDVTIPAQVSSVAIPSAFIASPTASRLRATSHILEHCTKAVLCL
jgi:hypothetical protein